MAISVKNYTNRFVVIAILVVMAIWAALFYAVIMDEVYDNIDDGLKNQKILILREVYRNPKIIEESKDFGVNQFVIREAENTEEVVDQNKFSKELIYMPYDEEEEPYRILHTGFYDATGKPYRLEIRTSTVEEDDFLINLAISLVVLYIVIVLSILIINHYMLGRAWQPFKQILKNLSKYRFGKANSFESVKSPVSEFNDLNNHIRHMIQQNEKVFDGQKRFLENAAHELQTPLAVGIGKLELVLENTSLNEEDTVRIVEAKRSLQRMVNLNKSLLTLSRINNQQYAGSENVNVNTVITDLLNDYEDLITYKEIQLNIQQDGIFEVHANPDLMQILFSNLLSNAVKYNVTAGYLVVLIKSDAVVISNTSQEKALNPDYIFERFYKGSQDHNSNGLGLSIIKTILEKYPFLKIQYSYQNSLQVFEIMRVK
ncbi:sensor histidine kinase [Sphingobacterium bovistauri]|uniref:histidine kinase n=1 Tax=Sphingobacterium bovistauri TaxID=2781959 RepID=A0ABS7Z7U5_9SPHI|nr:HAMP domain-containing sensor histidine kinase [Sphingobacterium bovistauri]MCA5005486.1 HAMP domain-containing histidine kinase [Sphingobacterium bovistauri]